MKPVMIQYLHPESRHRHTIVTIAVYTIGGLEIQYVRRLSFNYLHPPSAKDCKFAPASIETQVPEQTTNYEMIVITPDVKNESTLFNSIQRDFTIQKILSICCAHDRDS